jgi:hypothetical protein
MNASSHVRRERRQHELERVRLPHRPAHTHPPPKRNRSSIELPQFHGIYFRFVGRHRRAVYHQLDGSIEVADICGCRTEWDPDFRVERSANCPIDEHRIEVLSFERSA